DARLGPGFLHGRPLASPCEPRAPRAGGSHRQARHGGRRYDDGLPLGHPGEPRTAPPPFAPLASGGTPGVHLRRRRPTPAGLIPGPRTRHGRTVPGDTRRTGGTEVPVLHVPGTDRLRLAPAPPQP